MLSKNQLKLVRSLELKKNRKKEGLFVAEGPKVVGDLAMQSAIDQTANNDGLTLILALSYSGRTEITHAAKAIAQEVSQGMLRGEDIQPDTIAKHLYHSDVPDPDMLIRTGGECRISNVLLWQMAYTEFFFVPVMWPDFRKTDLREIIIDFQSRERRYGKTGMQVREH